MDIVDLLKKAMGITPDIDDTEIEKTWTQVTKLSAEDKLKFRRIGAASVVRERECVMLTKKIAALKAQKVADEDEWWFYIHKTYGLPKGDYHIHDDGRIFTKRKEQS